MAMLPEEILWIILSQLSDCDFLACLRSLKVFHLTSATVAEAFSARKTLAQKHVAEAKAVFNSIIVYRHKDYILDCIKSRNLEFLRIYMLKFDIDADIVIIRSMVKYLSTPAIDEVLRMDGFTYYGNCSVDDILSYAGVHGRTELVPILISHGAGDKGFRSAVYAAYMNAKHEFITYMLINEHIDRAYIEYLEDTITHVGNDLQFYSDANY